MWIETGFTPKYSERKNQIRVVVAWNDIIQPMKLAEDRLIHQLFTREWT